MCESDQCTVGHCCSSAAIADCFDCAGTPFGLSSYDICGICGSNITHVCLCPDPVAAGCPTCTPVNPADCMGVCDGAAVIDSCGECVGGTSGKSANATTDECGVCSADNSTCSDCLGTPHGTAVIDICGVCAGSNSTCLGCDSVPIPLGGKSVDACGVCGGGNLVCELDCVGLLGGPNHYDCRGVCGGLDLLLNCSTCPGGIACGPCNISDNSTCLGCDGTPIGLGGLVEDMCGECGGTHTACIYGCDNVLDSTAAFDCDGECNGTALLDTCGVCFGGTTGLVAEVYRDDCGDCFGGNAAKDSCRVCNGGNANRDDCGICTNLPSYVNLHDMCGVCFGGGRDIDSCGICFGNSTCLGCNNVPYSGWWIDDCGNCLPPTLLGCTTDPPNSENPLNIFSPEILSGAAGGAAVGIIALLILSITVFMRKRKRATAKSKLLRSAGAPMTEYVTLVTTDVQSSTALWEAHPKAMMEALDVHNELVRKLLKQYDGYELRTEGDSFVVAFEKSTTAIQWCVAVQEGLLRLPWPEDLLNESVCQPVPLPGKSKTDRWIWRGLRVRMTAHSFKPDVHVDPRTQLVTYKGPEAHRANLVSNLPAGGQIGLTDATAEQLKKDGSLPFNIVIRQSGRCMVKGMVEMMHEAVSSRVPGREFQPMKGCIDDPQQISSPASVSISPVPLRAHTVGSLTDLMDEVSEIDSNGVPYGSSVGAFTQRTADTFYRGQSRISSDAGSDPPLPGSIGDLMEVDEDVFGIPSARGGGGLLSMMSTREPAAAADITNLLSMRPGMSGDPLSVRSGGGLLSMMSTRDSQIARDSPRLVPQLSSRQQKEAFVEKEIVLDGEWEEGAGWG